MGKCITETIEMRFVLDKELTHVYCLVKATGDCPLGVHGWHYKAFPGSMPVITIVNQELGDHLLWTQKSP